MKKRDFNQGINKKKKLPRKMGEQIRKKVFRAWNRGGP